MTVLVVIVGTVVTLVFGGMVLAYDSQAPPNPREDATTWMRIDR